MIYAIYFKELSKLNFHAIGLIVLTKFKIEIIHETSHGVAIFEQIAATNLRCIIYVYYLECLIIITLII